MRIGLREMKAFSKLLFSSVKDSTFFESCGVADLITTCCKEADLFVFLVLLKFSFMISIARSSNMQHSYVVSIWQ